MNNRACLNCTHFQPLPHDGWQPRYEGDGPYDLYDLRSHLREQGRGLVPASWPGACRLYPVPAKVTTDHLCGHWAIAEMMVPTWLGWTAPFELRDQIASLELELKAAKALAVSRWRLLRKRAKRRVG